MPDPGAMRSAQMDSIFSGRNRVVGSALRRCGWRRFSALPGANRFNSFRTPGAILAMRLSAGRGGAGTHRVGVFRAERDIPAGTGSSRMTAACVSSRSDRRVSPRRRHSFTTKTTARRRRAELGFWHSGDSHDKQAAAARRTDDAAIPAHLRHSEKCGAVSRQAGNRIEKGGGRHPPLYLSGLLPAHLPAGECAGGARREHGRARRHPGVERLSPSGAVLCNFRVGRGDAHYQSTPASRTDRLYSQSRRRSVSVFRSDFRAAGRSLRRALHDGERLCRHVRSGSSSGRNQDTESAVL